MEIKVSVVVPVYNAEKYIERCITSILNQEFKELEVIAIDDGSKDNSLFILNKLASNDKRLKVIHQENSGVSTTRNNALKYVQGKYIQFIDADDWLPNNSTKVMVRAMEDNNVDLVVGDFYRVVNDKVSQKSSIEESKKLSLKEFASYMSQSPADYYYGVLWNKLYKKEIIEKYHLKFDKEVNFAEDFIFNLEYYLHCGSMYPVQVPVYYYVKTEGSLVSSTSLQKMIQSKASLYKYYESFFDNIMAKDEGLEERIIVSRYLVAIAKDGFTIPFSPSTKKLGKEKVTANFKANDNSFYSSFVYYLEKAYERYLDELSNQYDLEPKDIKVLSALKDSDQHFDVNNISDYTELYIPTVLMSLQKLRTKKIIHFNLDGTNLKLDVQLTGKAYEIIKAISIAENDLTALCTKGMNDDEKMELARLISVVNENLKQSFH